MPGRHLPPTEACSALYSAVRVPTLGLLQSSIDGFRRFAAPISFSHFLASGNRFPVPAQTKDLDMPIGTVKFFDNNKGYGFITNDAGGNDAFVHISAVEAAGMSSLEKEQRLSYELENDKRGKSSAVNLQTA
jgi:CspA family cold shock protein